MGRVRCEDGMRVVGLGHLRDLGLCALRFCLSGERRNGRHEGLYGMIQRQGYLRLIGQ